MTTLPLRVGGLSWQVRPRGVVLTLTGVVLLALLMALNMRIGDLPMTLADVVTGTFDAASPAHFVIMELRLPRALTGALVGAALALSGAIIQSIARNPLASPEILG
ncbi:iron chelate uptake ABC transporter family permease subunit, partial [Nonomuraea fuscirosea]